MLRHVAMVLALATTPVTTSETRQSESPRPQFMYTLRPTRLAMLTEGFNASERATQARHEAYLTERVRDGTILLAGRAQVADSTAFGIVIFAARDLSEARRIMESDPMVSEGVGKAQLFPYKIAYLSSGIALGK